MRYRFFGLRLILALAVLVGLSLFALCVGHYGQTPLETIQILLSRILPIEPTWTDNAVTVVMTVRLPRICGAVLVGAALSLAGATYQSIFKNPLVSPDLLGVSSGASVGAAITILIGLSAGATQVGALLGGLLAVLITVTIPKLMRNHSTLMLVLAGIIVQGFMSAAMGLIKFVADPEAELAEITYWQMGRLSNVMSSDVLVVFPAIAAASAVLIAIRWQINVLSMGDTEAEALGVNVRALRGVAVLCATVITACSVCISGVISWVGLIIPHMCRMLVGPDNTKMMPMSILVGASFMLAVDTVCRTLTTSEIPLSIITGFAGAPLYAWLLFRQRVKLK